MAPKGNNVIPNVHFHKDWQRYIKTWFNQPARKFRRRQNRIKKAQRIAPRPAAGPLRPIVHAPTLRYHTKVRLGRGFTLDEIKAAGLNKRFARTVGIAVDPRRRNKSVESLQVNVKRLKEYQSKLILFPLHNKKKLKKGEATEEERKLASQYKGTVFPLKKSTGKVKTRAITANDRKFSAYRTLRRARQAAKLVGVNEIKAREAAENQDDPMKAAKKAAKAAAKEKKEKK